MNIDEKSIMSGTMRSYNALLLIWLGVSSQLYAESQKENGEEKVEIQMELISAAQSIVIPPQRHPKLI